MGHRIYYFTAHALSYERQRCGVAWLWRCLVSRSQTLSAKVQSNVSIAVQFLSVRGQSLTSNLSAIAPEFNLDLKVVPECGDDPSLCPCPTNCKPIDPGKVSGKKSGNNSGRTAAIVVVVLVVIALVVLGIVIALIYILRWRRKSANPYSKNDLLGEPDESMRGTKGARGDEVTFDNPIYEVDTGKETKEPAGKGGEEGASSEEVKAREMEAIAILKPTGEEYEPFEVTKDVPTKVSPPKGRSGGKKVAALNEYERL